MGSIGSKYSATNGAQMQRRNFLSSIFATLFAAKTVNAEERKLSPVASEEHKTKFDENTLLDTIKDDPAFSGYSNLLFPRGRTAGLRLREASRLLPYHSYVMPKESAEVLNYMKDEVLKGKKIFYPLKTASNGRPVAGLFFFRGNPDAPFAIICPGGGFQYVGAIHEGFPIAKFLAGKGINAFVIVYRDGSAQAACDDLAQGIDFIFDHAKELQVSTKNYSLWGGSAGARMAAYLGSYGATEFGGKTKQRPSAVIMEYTGHTDISGTEPATFAVVGDQDGIASPWTMDQRINRLKAQGTPAEFRLIRGMPHGFGLGTGTPAEGWAQEALDFWLKNSK